MDEYFEGIKIEPIMYSSHGEFSKLKDIYETEQDRGNSTFDDVPKDILDKYWDNQAIWLTNPLQALRYDLTADEWDLSNEELMIRYPDYMECIAGISTNNLIPISCDCDDGILFVLQ